MTASTYVISVNMSLTVAAILFVIYNSVGQFRLNIKHSFNCLLASDFDHFDILIKSLLSALKPDKNLLYNNSDLV